MRILANSGIKEVVYLLPPVDEMAPEIAKESKIKCRELKMGCASCQHRCFSSVSPPCAEGHPLKENEYVLKCDDYFYNDEVPVFPNMTLMAPSPKEVCLPNCYWYKKGKCTDTDPCMNWECVFHPRKQKKVEEEEKSEEVSSLKEKDEDPWKDQRARAREEGIDSMVFGSDGHGPPK
jgi:hypothetical protein